MIAPLLVLKDLTLGYQGRAVLSDFNLAVECGRWVAVVGPNACGKTTLLRAIAGYHEPALGSIEICGHSLYSASTRNCALPGFAFPPQDLPPFLTVRQCLDIYANAHGLAAPTPECLALFELLALGAQSTTLVRNASLGTRQKLAVTLALMVPSQLLLLDEVFNGLDFSSALKLRKHLRERVVLDGLTIMLATHSLDVVLGCCDKLVLLSSGRLAKRWDMSDFTGPGAQSALEQALADAQ